MRWLRRLAGRLAHQDGQVSLAELLVGSSVMLVVAGAALTGFETFETVDRELVVRGEAQDEARTSLDRLARQLRNLASPTPNQPQAIDRATPYDVVFQSVDPIGPNAGANAVNVRRMRWCLDSGTPARLWVQTQTWTTSTAPAVPPTTTCPASGWASQTVAARDVVNRFGGQSRPVFTFDAAVLTDISAVHAELVVDREPGRNSAETRLSTGVFLRNQNRRPSAAFTVTRSPQGLVLNGSLSGDPEGQELLFRWYDGAVLVGTGVVFTYAVPSGSSHAIRLEVLDPAGLTSTSDPQQVTA